MVVGCQQTGPKIPKTQKVGLLAERKPPTSKLSREAWNCYCAQTKQL